MYRWYDLTTNVLSTVDTKYGFFVSCATFATWIYTILCFFTYIQFMVEEFLRWIYIKISDMMFGLISGQNPSELSSLFIHLLLFNLTLLFIMSMLLRSVRSRKIYKETNENFHVKHKLWLLTYKFAVVSTSWYLMSLKINWVTEEFTTHCSP